MSFLAIQRLAGFLATAAAFASMAISGTLPIPFSVGYSVALLLSLVIGDRLSGKLDFAWTVGLIATVAGLLFVTLSGGLDFVVSMAIVVAMLALNRLYNRRTVRDDALLHLTSLLMLAAGAALSAELGYGLCFAAFGVFATWSLMLSHLRAAIEDGSAEEGAAALLASRRLVTPPMLGALAALSFAALVGAVAVFLFFPRVTFGVGHGKFGESRVGFGDRVELDGHGLLKDDPRVAMRVRLSPAPPPSPLGYHWRGRAFDTWDGRAWSRATTARDAREPILRRDLNGAFLLERRFPGQPVVREDIELLPGVSDDILLSGGRTLTVRLPTGLGAETYRLLRDAQGELFYAPPTLAELHYSVDALPGAPQSAPDDQVLEGAEREKYLQLPPLDPRVQALAAKLQKEHPNLWDLTLAIQQEVSSRHYSVEAQPDVKDPIPYFLFKSRAGHCELFSTAMAVLLRANGIPARNVTGFYGGLPTEGGYWVLRQGDAHSWLEAWVEGRGWVEFDPTPEANRAASSGGLSEKMALFTDGLSMRWRAWVVDYNLRTQVDALSRFTQGLHGLTQQLAGRQGRVELKAKLRWVALGVGLLVSLLVLMVLSRRWKERRRRHRFAPLSEDALRAQRLFQALRLAAAEHGLHAPASRTATELVAAAWAGNLAVAPVVERVAERYLAARYGGAALSKKELAAMTKELIPEQSFRLRG